MTIEEAHEKLRGIYKWEYVTVDAHAYRGGTTLDYGVEVKYLDGAVAYEFVAGEGESIDAAYRQFLENLKDHGYLAGKLNLTNA